SERCPVTSVILIRFAPRFTALVTKPARRLCPPNVAGSKPSLSAPALTIEATLRGADSVDFAAVEMTTFQVGARRVMESLDLAFTFFRPVDRASRSIVGFLWVCCPTASAATPSEFSDRPPDARRARSRRLAGGPSLPPGVPGLTAWQHTGATMRRPLKTIEGARNATDHERINARPCSDCARSNRPVRELWPRGVRCD